MRLKQLFQKYRFEEVFPLVKGEYPDSDEKSYRHAWDNISEIVGTIGDESSAMTLIVEEVGNTFDAERLVDVSGLENGQKHAIEILPWEKWLNLEIEQKSFLFDDKTLLAHILFEMTFLGYSSKCVALETIDLLAELEKSRKEVEQWEIDGTLHKHVISLDDYEKAIKGDVR